MNLYILLLLFAFSSTALNIIDGNKKMAVAGVALITVLALGFLNALVEGR